MTVHDRMEALRDLHRATGDPSRLREAGRLLDRLLENAPPGAARTMVERVPLYREISSA